MYRQSYIYRFLKKCEKPEGNMIWEFFNVAFSFFMIRIGLLLYYCYRYKYKNAELCILPSTDAGDLLFLRYSNAYILDLYGQDAVFIFDNRNTRTIDTLKFRNVCLVSQFQIVPLAKAFYVYANSKMHNVYNWCFFDMKNVTHLYKKDIPLYVSDRKMVDGLFSANNLEKGRTVIIAPYEQGITAVGGKCIPYEVWKKLIIELKKNGYNVCVNCKGNDVEKNIEGGIQVFPKFEDLTTFVEQAGYMVSIRSGFCDYTMNVHVKKVILYPTVKYFEKWKMSNFSDDGQTLEIVYNDIEGKWADVIDEIIRYFNKN